MWPPLPLSLNFLPPLSDGWPPRSLLPVTNCNGSLQQHFRPFYALILDQCSKWRPVMLLPWKQLPMMMAVIDFDSMVCDDLVVRRKRIEESQVVMRKRFVVTEYDK